MIRRLVIQLRALLVLSGLFKPHRQWVWGYLYPRKWKLRPFFWPDEGTVASMRFHYWWFWQSGAIKSWWKGWRDRPW